MRRWWMFAVPLFVLLGRTAIAQDACPEALLEAPTARRLSLVELSEYGLRPRKDVAQQILAMLDEVRADMGLSRLTIDPGLAAAAEHRAFFLSTGETVCGPGALALERRLMFLGLEISGPLAEGATRFPVGLLPEESYIDQAAQAAEELLADAPTQELLLSPDIQYVGISVVQTSDEELTTVLTLSAEPSSSRP